MSATPKNRCLPIAEWPDIDRSLWFQEHAEIDPFAERGGSRARCRPITNSNVARGYGRWLTFLLTEGGELAAGSPADRINRGAVLRYVAYLERLGNQDSTILSRLQELREAAKVMNPDRDWSFIGRLASKVRQRGRLLSPRNRLLIDTAQLVDLGLKLIGEAEALRVSRRSAILYRDGLMIALLAVRPLRRGNIAELSLEDHLVRTGAGWAIMFSAASTKTHAHLDYEWPEILEEPLARYLSVFRPLLVGRAGRWNRSVGQRLWVSADGSPMTEMAVYDRVREHTRRAFGEPINPHRFRHIAATMLAVHFPTRVHEAGPLLGHRDPRTSDAHYNQARTLEAHRTFTNHLKTLRKTIG
jgi:integrase